MLFIAAFATTWAQRIAALVGAIGYGLLGFMMVERMSVDIKRKTSDKNFLMVMTLGSFLINYYALSSYLKNYFVPLLLVGPGLLLGLWIYFKAK
ncbi:hypothetical protein PYCH_12040 [Pyrococcus yayanosii CH1]|uniref:Uncharacterized protein n=2 Tax=Pyrococcus TaxID=2260 RepID=F8AF36_PYRYC|nr:hypothetical protein PYCH_12040 [Pyrococcus yayanosii CH1]